MAAMFSITVFLILLNFESIQVLADQWIFGTADLRFLAVKIALGILLRSVLLAIKRHYMTGLAVTFNYSNYRDRVQESLFADRMLNLMQKSRHTYKYRQKLRTRGDTSAIQSAGHVHHPSPDYATGIREAIKSRQIASPEHSVRSAKDIFPSVVRAEPSSLMRQIHSGLTPSLSSPLSVSQAPTSPASRTDPSQPCHSPPMRSVAAYLTESDKKRQFSEFFRLANQMISRFSNVADYRAEIATEAKRLSSKLYKYLRQYGREYLLGEDLLPYIEDETEFRRAVTLIKRYAENSSNAVGLLSVEDAGRFAFSAVDLNRSIDGILTELYVTAKSLQTIETALDKVDSFFTFLVALTMIIIVAIVVGDAVKLLLALSTVLSGAAFAFGTSARNMSSQ